MLNGYSLTDKFGRNAMYITGGNNRRVHTLISNHNWKNNLELVPTQIYNTMKNIKIHNHMQQDHWFWLPNRDGQIT